MAIRQIVSEETTQGLSVRAGKTRDLESTVRKFEKRDERAAEVDEDIIANVSEHANGAEMQAAAEMDEDQRAATKMLLNNTHCVLEGPAGTGKTFVMVNCLADLVEQVNSWKIGRHFTLGGEVEDTQTGMAAELEGPGIVCLAWQAKVASNLRNRLSSEFQWRGMDYDLKLHASTIHNFLKFAPAYNDIDGTGEMTRKFEPRFDALNQHDCPILLIDEVGTVSENLLLQLQAATPEGTRIIAMGDLSQLPPVAGRATYPYMMKAWPTFPCPKSIDRPKAVPSSTTLAASSMVSAPSARLTS